MQRNVIFLEWNRPVMGREKQAVETLNELTQYLIKQQQQGTVRDVMHVGLEPRTTQTTGFIVVQGDNVEKLISDDTFQDWMARASSHLKQFGVTFGYAGQQLERRQKLTLKYT